MVANSPGILPKTALVASRAVYYPFTIPTKLNDSSTLVGTQLNHMVGGINAAVGNAYMELKPRGPAKWLAGLFTKVDAAVKHSDEIALRNKTVFWDPFSQGTEAVGRALASPGTYWYLKKAGVEQPTQDMIKGVLNMPFFSFPSAPPSGDGGGGDAAAAAEAAAAAAQQGGGGGDAAAQQAAEGAAQAA